MNRSAARARWLVLAVTWSTMICPPVLAQRPSLDSLQGQLELLQNQIDSLSSTVNQIGHNEIKTVSSGTNGEDIKQVLVSCDAGDFVAGGGGEIIFSAGSVTPFTALTKSYPLSETIWVAEARAELINPLPVWRLVAYAVCVSFD